MCLLIPPDGNADFSVEHTLFSTGVLTVKCVDSGRFQLVD